MTAKQSLYLRIPDCAVPPRAGRIKDKMSAGGHGINDC